LVEKYLRKSPLFLGFFEIFFEFFSFFFNIIIYYYIYIKKIYMSGPAQLTGLGSATEEVGPISAQMGGPILAQHVFIYFFGVKPDLAQNFGLGQIRLDPTSTA
jgi:hypothetical protein